MHFTALSTVAAVVSFPWLASASPVATPRGISIPITRRTSESGPVADIGALRTHLARLTEKYARTSENFKKNTGTDHPLAPVFNVSSGLTKRLAGSETLTDDSNGLWYGNVDIGTPPRTFSIRVDTASSDLFIPSSSCEHCDSHTTYNSSASSTSKSLGKTFLLHNDGYDVTGEDVVGNMFADKVSIAGLTATDQTFGSATTSSTFTTPVDGILGLGFPSLSFYPAMPFFNTLMRQGKVGSGQFSLKLATSGSSPSLFLGGADSSLYSGPINWNRVTQPGYWQITLDAIFSGRSEFVTNGPSIIDTETPFIVGDPLNVLLFYSTIRGSAQADNGQYTFPCSWQPMISLKFGGISYDVPWSRFNLGPVSAGSSNCYGALVATEGLNNWIIGDVFLQEVSTVFDFDKRRVGFAKLV